MKSRFRVVAPLWDTPAWEHPNTVFSHNVYAGAFDTPNVRESAGVDVGYTDLAVTPFTINEGDHVLVCHAGIPSSSGHKFADDLSSATAFPSATNAIHLSAHQAKLGAGATNYIGGLYSTGYESRARFWYIDRENFESVLALANQDGTAPYGPAEFAGIQTDAGTGTDAGIGDVTISALVNNEWLEDGPIHVIRWTAGNAPPRSVIETAMEWMWYEWHRNNFVLYPTLIHYT